MEIHPVARKWFVQWRHRPIALGWLCLLLVLAGCATKARQIEPAHYLQHQNQCVVLVHGLWRSGGAMSSIADDLEAAGYHTVSIDYPSTEATIPTLASQYLAPGYDACQQRATGQIHFVAHSMGGILVRQFLQDLQLPAGSKVVMLSPPNQGSELSEKFGESWWYQWIAGPAAVSLKAEQGIIRQLKEISAPVGIIAAYRAWSLWPDSWLPQPNDGTVSVESMKLAEMDDFILVNSGHAMMRYSDTVQNQIRQFLNTGKFDHASSEYPITKLR